MSARRSRRKLDWPRGLYEPRTGYYVWRHPDGRTLPIGRVPLAVARNEALAANQHVVDTKPGLVERLTGGTHTMAEVLEKMPPARAKETAGAYRGYDKRIREALGTKACSQLTVADCANLIEGVKAEGKMHAARYLRSRLIMVCRRAQQLGWAEMNPAEVTGPVEAEVKRQRLTLEMFQAIYAEAPKAAEWLQHAMMLGLVTGQDRSTICAMERSHVQGDALIVWRGKTRRTNKPVAIPLALRLDVVGVSVGELVSRRTNVISKYLVHHVRPWSSAPAGSAVTPDAVSAAFSKARDLAGISGENPPTFHEIRSLAKREYVKQGGVDTKTLLGHASDSAAAVYADPRGVEAMRVKIN